MIPISPHAADHIGNALNASAHHRPAPPQEQPTLREAAVAFEAVFLAEMLSHAGMGATSGGVGDGGFDGGAGEDAFASLLTREWATQLSEQGGIGLSDAIYRSLVAREASDG